jgi:carbonic anhydrase
MRTSSRRGDDPGPPNAENAVQSLARRDVRLITNGEANPADLFSRLGGARVKRGQVRVDSFYAYAGSLTTPRCTENVCWSLLSDGGHVSRAAAAHFHAVIAQFANYGGYANNNRPAQPLNGRVIQFRCGAKRHR